MAILENSFEDEVNKKSENSKSSAEIVEKKSVLSDEKLETEVHVSVSENEKKSVLKEKSCLNLSEENNLENKIENLKALLEPCLVNDGHKLQEKPQNLPIDHQKFKQIKRKNKKKSPNSLKEEVTKVRIGYNMVGAIIGSKGCRINKIQSDSKAKIDINDDRAFQDSNDRIVAISGTQEEIEMAQFLLQKCVSEQIANPMDWMCPESNCSFWNFRKRTACHKCSTSKPKLELQHSTDNPKPMDWLCPKSNCCFMNFGKRTVCYKCSTSNPKLELSKNVQKVIDSRVMRIRGLPFYVTENIIYEWIYPVVKPIGITILWTYEDKLGIEADVFFEK